MQGEPWTAPDRSGPAPREEQSAKAMEDLLPSALESVTQAELAADTVQSAASVADVRRQLAAAKLQVSRALEASKSFAPKAQRLAKVGCVVGVC